jgi:1-pyrroline-5-carboxylate dehydrogenase
VTFSTEPLTDFTDRTNVELYQAALKKVRDQLGADYPLIISGQGVETGAWMESHNPANISQLIGRSAQAGPGEVDRALEAAWDAFPAWSTRSMSERADLLHGLATVLRRRKFELAAWLSFEAAKNYAEADAEAAEAIDFVEYYAAQSLPLAEPVETFSFPGEENTTMLRPLGAGAVIWSVQSGYGPGRRNWRSSRRPPPHPLHQFHRFADYRSSDQRARRQGAPRPALDQEGPVGDGRKRRVDNR